MHRPRPAGRGAPIRALAGVAALMIAASASYTVQPGESLSEIARAQGVPTDALASANDITDPDVVLAGQRLAVPDTTGTAGTTDMASSDSSGAGTDSDAATSHEVQPGDNLSGLAQTYGVSIQDLMAANELSNPDHVAASTVLEIPSSAASSPQAPSPETAQPPAAPPGAAARSEVGELLDRTARQHGWSPAFVKAVAWQESGWQNHRVSSAGARGIMQVMPDTGRFVSQQLAGRTLDLGDPNDNVLAGVLFLDYLHGLTGGDAEMTLAGYYQGLASVRDNGMYDDTRAYINSVLALRERFR